ncbi:metalloregulator ArsR/SmtB family transcription factor [Demequina globuliformis]|uniref:metalloregulator ArsR/SmtB family transcription factor n=1 Tax=Demequina globuliformis TaxID=676202 RepID=UPI000783C7FE|nr:metalloregulator ArsR/SmtB family transcription factor [Demequina globuliformis]
MTSTAADCSVGNIEAHSIDAARAAQAATILKALADPLRLRMLAVIASAPDGEVCVCDLSSLAQVSDPTVSYHLKALRTAGLVLSHRRGTWVYYRVDPQMKDAVEALLQAFVATPQKTEHGAGGHDADAPHGLDHVERALESIANDLAHALPELEPALVTRTVQESYTSLLSRAKVRQHLIPLTRQFARQRLQDVAKARTPDRGHVPQVLFVCVQNAGRSQLAAALVRHYAGERVTVRSAGSMPATDVHDNVAPLVAELGPTADAFPKPLTDDAVRASDVVITMGCGDVCPVYPGKRYEDWRVGDPALASQDGVRAIRDDIDARVRHLLSELVPDLDLPAEGA